ncbi:hypothetical protein FRB96_009340 [Tulasnella sp. 330]|nr:hypothetical protein FRB96_009340 [Tulasnella sp. 330]
MEYTHNSDSESPPSRVERISFNGADSEDVTEFVREVNRIALDQGRWRDQEWMANYAEACLGGSAIRWFSGLEEDFITSWRELRRALLDRFGPPSGRQEPRAAGTAATISDAASAFSNRLTSLETTVERLQMSNAQFQTISENLQRQVDACSQLVTELQVDARSYIAQTRPDSLSAMQLHDVTIAPSSPSRGRTGRIKVIEPGKDNPSYLCKGESSWPNFVFTETQAESQIFELLTSEGDPDRLWLRLVDHSVDDTTERCALVLGQVTGSTFYVMGFGKGQTLQFTDPDYQTYPISCDVWLEREANGSGELKPSWAGGGGTLDVRKSGYGTHLWCESEGAGGYGVRVVSQLSVAVCL